MVRNHGPFGQRECPVRRQAGEERVRVRFGDSSELPPRCANPLSVPKREGPSSAGGGIAQEEKLDEPAELPERRKSEMPAVRRPRTPSKGARVAPISASNDSMDNGIRERLRDGRDVSERRDAVALPCHLHDGSSVSQNPRARWCAPSREGDSAGERPAPVIRTEVPGEAEPLLPRLVGRSEAGLNSGVVRRTSGWGTTSQEC